MNNNYNNDLANVKIYKVDDIQTKTPVGELIDALTVEKYIKDCEFKYLGKISKPIVVQSNNSVRPKHVVSEYYNWSGFQPLDVDIKHERASVVAKEYLTKLMFRYKWCRAITLSPSGSGLHIYTYTKPYTSDIRPINDNEFEKYKEHYMDSYEFKSIILWKSLVIASEQARKDGLADEIWQNIHPVLNTTSRRLKSDGVTMTGANVVDASVCKISQPLYISSDKEIRINDGFRFMHTAGRFSLDIYSNTNKRFEMNVLKEDFDRMRNRYEIKDHERMSSNKLKTDFDTKDNIKIIKFGSYTDVTPMDYDNEQRYQMAYTLANLHDITSPSSVDYRTVLDMYLYMCSGNPKYGRERTQWSQTFKSAVARNSVGTAPMVWKSIKDLNEYHGYELRIDNSNSHTKEVIKDNNTVSLIEEFINEEVEIDPLFKINETMIINLEHNEYIGHKETELINHLQVGTNYLIAPPGIGKTEFIKRLTLKGYRVLLIEPYTSIISSKIEGSDLNMTCFYGDIKTELSTALNCCMTFDKFCNVDADEVSLLYDFVAVDESHLLTMSSYRGNVPANVIDNIKKLSTKTILMTGTPVAEHVFCGFETITRFNKAEKRDKNLDFVICKHDNDKLTKIAQHIARLIQDGHKVLYPTNKGDEYQRGIIGAVKSLIKRNPIAKYYKRDNALYEFVSDINDKGTLGEVEILFCTNYLSVGIDINDTCPFDIIYDETFTAQEIEQFNCRLRKLDLMSYYYFSQENLNGDVKNITNYEPLDLTYTEDQQLEFSDIQQSFLKRAKGSNSLYDFFSWAFDKPYFVRDRKSGEITTNHTSYRLHNFEERWRRWAQQLNIVRNTLSEFGYTTRVIENPISTDFEMGTTVNASKEAKKEYKNEKNNKISSLLSLIRDERTFKLVTQTEEKQIIESDRYEFATKRNKIHILVDDSNIYYNWRRKLRKLGRYYSYDKVLDIIMDRCYNAKTNIYSEGKINKLLVTLDLFNSTKQKRLVESNAQIISYIIKSCFGSSFDTAEIDKELMDMQIDSIVDKYIDVQANHIKSFGFRNKIKKRAKILFNSVTDKVGKDKFELISLPKFNSSYVIKRNQLTDVLSTLFNDNMSGQFNSDVTHDNLVDDVDNLIFDRADENGYYDEYESTDLTELKKSDDGLSNYISFTKSDESESNEFDISKISTIKASDYKFPKTIIDLDEDNIQDDFEIMDRFNDEENEFLDNILNNS